MTFTVIIEPDVVHDEIAAEPETLRLYAEYLMARQEPEPSWMAALRSPMFGLPLVADGDLPPGEVHMRCTCPVPYRPAERDANLRAMLDYFSRTIANNPLTSGDAADNRGEAR